MSGFVHLHNHSDYSLLDGACRISDYVKKAVDLGMKHLALTDHGNLFGALHFEQACHAAGINPVVGCEVYVAPGSRFVKPTNGPKSHHMVLYVRNEEGYRNLMILTSKGYIEGFYYKPRIDDELLEKHHEGLIASTACMAGEIPRALQAGDFEKAKSKALFYRDLFGEGNFYLEVMNHGIPEEKTIRKGMRR
ncbi:MAG: DNA polymerase III subunit alpha, partial [Spirochaetes bacterium]